MPARPIAELLMVATEKLRSAGISNARLDAELLLAHCLRMDRGSFVAHPERAISERTVKRFSILIHERACGTPLAYLTGSQAFFGLSFIVSPGVLIPRPETELLVEQTLECLPKDRSAKIADIGTGSGCIAVALAKYRPRVQVLAIDRSPIALRISRQNAKLHAVTNQLEFKRGDLLTPLRAIQLDLIVANLPYLTPKEIQNELTIKHEPRLALSAGPDGLRPFRRLFTQYHRQRISCPMLLEIDPRRKSALDRLARHMLPDMEQRWYRDLAGRWRVLRLRPIL